MNIYIFSVFFYPDLASLALTLAQRILNKQKSTLPFSLLGIAVQESFFLCDGKKRAKMFKTSSFTFSIYGLDVIA